MSIDEPTALPHRNHTPDGRFVVVALSLAALVIIAGGVLLS